MKPSRVNAVGAFVLVCALVAGCVSATATPTLAPATSAPTVAAVPTQTAAATSTAESTPASQVPATPVVPTGAPSNVPASPSLTAEPTTSSTLVPLEPSALVGQWRLVRSCEATATALTKEGLGGLVPSVISAEELIYGLVNGGHLPADFDAAHPCVDAKPPFEHSHTFWANGHFNSWDENGNQADDGAYTLAGDHSFTMGDPPITFDFTVRHDTIQFQVKKPVNCSADPCHGIYAWAVSVADPGQVWTRVTSGPHVP
jgi:hypothetical protein